MKRSLKPCNEINCPTLTRERYCEQHKQVVNEYDKRRGSSSKRGYDGKWRKARTTYLAKNPFCVDCFKEGNARPATVVDHIVPHKGDQKLFWDKTNWQGMCESHHNRKTATQDMGSWRRHPRP
jgi:5-methylcytosine-specific restriction enzyme A